VFLTKTAKGQFVSKPGCESRSGGPHLGQTDGRLTSLLDVRLDEPTRKALDSLCTEPRWRCCPELGISNDSIAYYAALVDYYIVQKLQQLTQGMARLYLLCFLLQRYQRINDN
jgi:hypothetical protein